MLFKTYFSLYLQRAYGTVKLKIGRVPSLFASLCSAKTKQSYINHALEDDAGTEHTYFISF